MTPDSTPREVLPPQGLFQIPRWNRLEDWGKTIAMMGWMQFWSYTIPAILCPFLVPAKMSTVGFYSNSLIWGLTVIQNVLRTKMNPSHCRNWYCVPKTPIRYPMIHRELNSEV